MVKYLYETTKFLFRNALKEQLKGLRNSEVGNWNRI